MCGNGRQLLLRDPCFGLLRDVTFEQSKTLKSVAKGLESGLLGCAMALENAHGRLHFAEICCTSDSKLAARVSALGGRAKRYIHGNGFDLSNKAGFHALTTELIRDKPILCWWSPTCGPDSPDAEHQPEDARATG